MEKRAQGEIMTKANIYTVHQRLSACEAELAGLRLEIATLKTNFFNSLKQFVYDNRPKDGTDGAPGKDGESIVGPKGDKGERGDVLYVGNEELEPIVARLRSELVLQRARYQALILQACAEDERMRPNHRSIFRQRLENIKREFGL
jgi:hypothetical protein